MEAQDFLVEELLDYPNGDENMAEAFFGGSATGNSTDSSVTAVHSSNSSVCGGADNGFGRSSADADLAGEICLPYDDDAAELEWLSNFVEESFSSDVLHKHHFFSGAGADQARSETSITGKARSRLAGRIAPSDWSTAAPGSGPAKKPGRKRAEISDRPEIGEVRRCQHCAAEKTPQWRTGPMGPKTLCNACGVRYKSGRLVPEYRPASSPTFVSTKHSNSHRKVLELRRQNEVIQMHHHQRFMEHGAVAGVFGHGGAAAGGDYLMHHHHGSSDYRRLI